MANSELTNKSGQPFIDDHIAEQINRMAEKFYSVPENVKKFEEWHLKTYGYLPEQSGKFKA